jgi:hypothetical protein
MKKFPLANLTRKKRKKSLPKALKNNKNLSECMYFQRQTHEFTEDRRLNSSWSNNKKWILGQS